MRDCRCGYGVGKLGRSSNIAEWRRPTRRGSLSHTNQSGSSCMRLVRALSFSCTLQSAERLGMAVTWLSALLPILDHLTYAESEISRGKAKRKPTVALASKAKVAGTRNRIISELVAADGVSTLKLA